MSAAQTATGAREGLLRRARGVVAWLVDDIGLALRRTAHRMLSDVPDPDSPVPNVDHLHWTAQRLGVPVSDLAVQMESGR